MAFGKALNQAMQAEAAEIVGHPSGSYLIRVLADQGSPLIPQIAVAEPRRQKAKRHQRTPESLNLRVGEGQSRSSLLVNLNRTIHTLKGGFGQHTVMADLLDFEQTSVGLEADLPQGGQVREPLADVEIARVVHGDLGAERSTFFVILLDPVTFVIDIEGRNHPLGNDAGAKATGRSSGDPAVENELYVLRAAEVEVFADDFFEEDAAAHGAIQHLRERELGLQNGEIIAISGLAIPGGKGWGSRRSHFRNKASIFAAERPSQRACRRSGSAQERMPLSRAS